LLQSPKNTGVCKKIVTKSKFGNYPHFILRLML